MPATVGRRAQAFAVTTVLGLAAAVFPIALAANVAAASNASAVAHVQHATVTAAAAAGASWIARDINPNGALVDAVSHKASAGDTADAILALVAAGEGASQVKSATHWLEHHFSSYVAPKGGPVSPGGLGLVILAAVAAGADPVHFGGQTGSNNLVARLRVIEHLGGASAGVFGAATSANAFSQSLALLALVAVKGPATAIHLAATYLTHHQCRDGGWQYSLITPCARPNPKTYSGPDTNSSALAVMAVVAAGGRFPHDPLAFFRASQETDGSFGYYGLPGDGQRGDPDSTAEVVQALIALGATNDKQFVRHAITPRRALESFQYRCGAPAKEQGEFSYFGAPSQYATLQAVPALAGATLPVSARKLSAAVFRLTCSAG